MNTGMEQAKVIKDAKVIEVVQVVYLAGKENSSTNPLRLITEYRSKQQGTNPNKAE